MRWLPLALLLAATPAAAQAPAPTRLTGRLDGTTARISARFALPVEAGAWSQAQARIPLPRGGVITAARATLGGATHPLALVRADEAQARFGALLDAGRPGEPASAVLLEGEPEAVRVSVASARGGTLLVDLEAAVPTCYHREARYVAVPDGWTTIAGALPRARRASRDALAAACGAPGEDQPGWVGFASRDVARRPSGERVAVSGERVDLGDATVVRVEVEVATALADVPRDLATVLVVDGSRSLDADERQAQRDLASAYLARAPGSRVQLVAFARHARALLPGWMTAAQGRAAVDKALARLDATNGSNIDAGLREAGAWLARIEGTRRLLLVTDQRLARRLQAMTAAELTALVPPGTLIHVVVPTARSGELFRDDTAPLAGVAAATRGMLVRAGPAADGHPIDATCLVRPIALDDLTVTAPGWTPLPRAAGQVVCADDVDTLDEGTACTWWGQARDATTPITIAGKIWGTQLTRVVTPSPARATAVARELLTRDLAPFAAGTRAAIEDAARAVNARWSLYAQWGGAGAYAQQGGGAWLGALCGCDGPGDIGHGGGTGTGHALGGAPQVDLRTQLASQLATCQLGAARVDVEVELTLAEIADVHVAARTAHGAEKARLERCVAEVVWASSPRIAAPRDHQVMTFVAGG